MGGQPRKAEQRDMYDLNRMCSCMTSTEEIKIYIIIIIEENTQLNPWLLQPHAWVYILTYIQQTHQKIWVKLDGHNPITVKKTERKSETSNCTNLSLETHWQTWISKMSNCTITWTWVSWVFFFQNRIVSTTENISTQLQQRFPRFVIINHPHSCLQRSPAEK